MNLTFEAIITLLTTLGVGGILGSLITHLLERRWEIKKKAALKKEEQYKNFLESLLCFFTGWEDQENQQKSRKTFMREFYTHAPLYASDEVIEATNKFLHSLKKDGDLDLEIKGKSDMLHRELILTIRKEVAKLNKEKTNLHAKDFEVLKLDIG